MGPIQYRKMVWRRAWGDATKIVPLGWALFIAALVGIFTFSITAWVQGGVEAMKWALTAAISFAASVISFVFLFVIRLWLAPSIIYTEDQNELEKTRKERDEAKDVDLAKLKQSKRRLMDAKYECEHPDMWSEDLGKLNNHLTEAKGIVDLVFKRSLYYEFEKLADGPSPIDLGATPEDHERSGMECLCKECAKWIDAKCSNLSIDDLNPHLDPSGY